MGQLECLLELKFQIFLNGFRSLKKRSQFEFFTLILFLLAAAAALFFFFWQSFRFFKNQEPFGPILIDESFYLFNFALFIMLFISSAVSSYTSLFVSPEVPFLIPRPIEWSEVYFLKLFEALWFSSWSFLFIAIPFMAAYGIHKDVGLFFFPFLCLIFYLPLIALSGMLGTLCATLAVGLLPGKKHRGIALIFGMALVALWFLHAGPHAIKEQGSIASVMSGSLPHVTFAKNPLLPSSWATRGILALSNLRIHEKFAWEDGIFYFLLLLSNALFFYLPSYSAGKNLYPKSFLRMQDHAQAQTPRRIRRRQILDKIFDRAPWPSQPAMAFLEKDLKTFSRDPSEWSQFLIFFGLLLLYFSNLKNLNFHVFESFWKNIIFVLNTVGTYIVLSSFNMRFIFPMLSLEGSRFWMIGLAPIRFSTIMLEKFLFGTVASAFLVLPLVFLSGWMLEISLARVLFTTGLGFFVCVALTGLSVGLGAKFPNFKSTNPAEIISGFGGSALLVLHLLYLALIGLFLISAQRPHWLIFLTVAFASLLIGMIPLKMGASALERMEF